MIDGQETSLCWYQSTIRDTKPILFCFHGNSLKTFAVFYYVALSLTRGFSVQHSSVRASFHLRLRSPYLYPQGEGGTVMPPGIGFHFRRLLRGGSILSHLHTVPAFVVIVHV
jgi:hypothetical protein